MYMAFRYYFRRYILRSFDALRLAPAEIDAFLMLFRFFPTFYMSHAEMMLRGDFSPRSMDRIFDALARLMLCVGTEPLPGCVVVYHTFRLMQVFSSPPVSFFAPQ